MEAITGLATLIRDGGWLVVLMIILWAGHKRYWVWGYQLDEAERRAQQWQTRADTWQDLAWKGTHAAEQAVDLMSTAKRDRA